MAPANPMVPLMVSSLWTGYVALKDEASRLPPPKLMAVKAAAMKACDAQDGVTDGVIADPRRCSFDPAVLACKAGDAPDCLTPAQVTALRGIYAGPRNARTGEAIFAGFSVGSEAMFPIQTSGPEPFPVATTFMKGLVFENPQWDFRSFDYDKDVQRAKGKYSAILDVPPTGLDAFFAQRRKLLLSHGWADGLIPAQNTVNFYDALTRSIGAKAAGDGVRLFMVPGMGHCAGGDGPSSIDMIGAIDEWVTVGKAPERLVASNPPGAPARTRPLCAHPQVAKYTGSGSTDDEKNFRCEKP
jgi:feruloyl esterase